MWSRSVQRTRRTGLWCSGVTGLLQWESRDYFWSTLQVIGCRCKWGCCLWTPAERRLIHLWEAGQVIPVLWGDEDVILNLFSPEMTEKNYLITSRHSEPLLNMFSAQCLSPGEKHLESNNKETKLQKWLTETCSTDQRWGPSPLWGPRLLKSERTQTPLDGNNMSKLVH